MSGQAPPGWPEPLASRKSPSVATSGSPVRGPALSTKSIDDSTVFINEVVCLSQAHPSVETLDTCGGSPVDIAVVPETLPEFAEVEDDLSFRALLKDNVLPDIQMTESIPSKA
ncbi:hypothetical protein KC19_VG325300 [Ceratodon purpureus]|uniref:Uncharacterized protein n=1 Tax=Ceratodon purpureus TaxID=3225 RepID=A0A8T0HWU5_CERPU|nr:hypothetical protein KC19_VG325300 [Ceratodon purpureus]